jgi:hypothetical protein
MRNAEEMLVGEPEEKRLFGKSRRGWEDNIKMDVDGIGYGVDSSGRR